MCKKDNIALIGFMASGKTTVGRILADKLGMKFLDTDDLLRDKAGKDLPEIFKTDGEKAFRKLEKSVVLKVSRFKNTLISTGGGVVLDPENVSALRKNAVIIWLKISPKEVLKRIKPDGTRPLLECEDPLKRAKQLIEKRESIYRDAAHYTIYVDLLSVEEVVEKIIEVIGL